MWQSAKDEMETSGRKSTCDFLKQMCLKVQRRICNLEVRELSILYVRRHLDNGGTVGCFSVKGEKGDINLTGAKAKTYFKTLRFRLPSLEERRTNGRKAKGKVT